MKPGVCHILFIFLLLTSCNDRHEQAVMPVADSARVFRFFYQKAWVAHSSDSILRYADLAGCYLSSEEQRAHLYYNVASRCMEVGDTVQALSCYRKAGFGADTWIQERICLSVAAIYARAGNYLRAVRCLDSIRSSRISRSVVPYYCLAKGNVFVAMGASDSALHYYEIAARSLNRFVAGEALHRLGLLYALRGEDSLAYGVALDADKLLQAEIQKVESDESRENYEKEKMKNELNSLKIAKQQQEIMLLSLGMSFIVIGFIFYFWWQRRKRRTNNLLLCEQALRLEQAQQLLEQAEELTSLREKESQLRESLFRRMKSFHKIPSLEEQAEEDSDEAVKDGKRIALSSEEWADIRQTVDKSYDDFTGRLRKEFPLLTDKDINFCCLVKIGVSIKDLSDIYCISRPSVSRKKQRVKREKFGLTAEDETLDAFLRRF